MSIRGVIKRNIVQTLSTAPQRLQVLNKKFFQVPEVKDSCSSMPSEFNGLLLLLLCSVPIETLDVQFLSQVCLSIWNFLIPWLQMVTLSFQNPIWTRDLGFHFPRRNAPFVQMENNVFLWVWYSDCRLLLEETLNSLLY